MISDLDLVRTFLAVVEAGSFTAAASGVYRSQAAVSQQIRRLESQVGARLFERGQREVTLSHAGRRLLPHARQLLDASEQARLAAHGTDQRRIRIGVPDDLAGLVMPALANLASHDRTLAFEVVTGSTRELHASMPARLEIVIGLAIPRLRDGVELARLRIRWFGRWHGGSIPLALCTEGCLLRRQALAALDRAGLAWHLCVAATSVGVVQAAIAGGMAVGPLLEVVAPETLPRAESLPPPGDIGMRMYADSHIEGALLDRLPDALRQRVAACTPISATARTFGSPGRTGRGQNRSNAARQRAPR